MLNIHSQHLNCTVHSTPADVLQQKASHADESDLIRHPGDFAVSLYRNFGVRVIGGEQSNQALVDSDSFYNQLKSASRVSRVPPEIDKQPKHTVSSESGLKTQGTVAVQGCFVT